ncbi:hypothetical protein Tco_0518142 [Tanacetum coccineum]
MMSWLNRHSRIRYVGPFKVLEKVGEVAYKLELPKELSRVHNTFHVSNLKKCHADEPLAVPLDGLHLDDKLHFVEEPLEIVGREVTVEAKLDPISQGSMELQERSRVHVASDDLRDALSVIFGLSELKAQISTQIENAIANVIPSQVDASVRSYMFGHIFHVHPAQSQTSSVPEQQYQLYLAMKADPQLQQQDISIWLALQMKFERNTVLQTACRTPAVRPRDQDDPHDDAHPEGKNSAKRQKSSEYEAYQDDDFDFWTDSYASDDDEIPSKQVSQKIMEEVSLTIDEAKLRKMADEMLRQRCTSGDEHQYHIDQMKNFLKSDIVWESRKEILKENSGPEKIVLSLHKFPAIIFNDDDIEEQTSRWVNKRVKKFNPYARYGVEHWKNPHARASYIIKQKEPVKPKKGRRRRRGLFKIKDHSSSTALLELGHEHKFNT